jgi:hypothetical protein
MPAPAPGKDLPDWLPAGFGCAESVYNGAWWVLHVRGVWGEPSWPPEAAAGQRRPGRRVADPITDRVGYPAQADHRHTDHVRRNGTGSTRRSAACAVDDHPVCPHLMGFKMAGEELCCCSCHDACQYTGTVNATPQEWWGSCSCPGSEWMREEGRRRWGRDRPPTLEEARRSARADDAAWSEVQAAVQPRSAGRSRAEVRQLIIEELRSRNRPVPDDMILDPHVDQIMLASPLPPLMDPDTSALTALKTLLRTARQARTQHKRFAAAMSSAARPLLGPHGQPPYLVEPDYSLPMADVVLDPGATAMPERSGGGIVSLERDPGAGDAARVVVYSGQQRVGTLSAADGARYQSALDAAQQAGCSLMVWSKVSDPGAGPPRLRVYLAGIL